MKKSAAGFTLVEVLVVVAIIAVLSSIMFLGFDDARMESRDAKRQTDLKALQAAIELYKNDNGQYPLGCNGVTIDNSTNWSGQPGSGHDCSTAGEPYILGLAPKYIPVLPTDPKLNPNPDTGSESGYVYTTNSERSVYKVMALMTVETESLHKNVPHTFFRCGSDYTLGNTGTSDGWEDPSVCDRVPSTYTGNAPNYGSAPRCENSNHNRTTYALMGGFSSNNRGNTSNPLVGMEYDTEIIRCR